MDLFNPLGKYRRIVKEENNFNYKYNPLLNSGKSNHKKLSEIYRDNTNIKKIKLFSRKEKEKRKEQKNINENNIKNNYLISDYSLVNKGSVLEEKFFLSQIKKKRRLLLGNKEKIKGYFTKSQCPFCRKVLSESEKEKEPLILEKILTDPNINYEKIRSILFFKASDFPLINIKVNKYFSLKRKLQEEKEDKMKIYGMTYDKKVNMESELSKKRKDKKYTEIKRKEIKMNNLFMIKKPFLTTLRGKIYKNMRQRYKKPLRLIILDSKNNNPINTTNNNKLINIFLIK